MHAYNIADYFITYIRTFGPLCRFAFRHGDRSGSDTTFRTGFCVPVGDVCSTRRLATVPGTSLLKVPPHIEAATRDDGAEVFCAFAAESIETLSSLERQPKNAMRSRDKTHWAWTGPEAPKLLFFMFSRRRQNHNRQALFF